MRKILVVIDMQNDFVTGPLGTPEARAIVSRISKKMDEAHENGDIVILTQDTHLNDYLETIEGKHLPIPHGIIDSDGWRIIPELSSDVHDIVIPKHTFGSTELIDAVYMAMERDISYIELCGVCTDVCVISNALAIKTYFYNDFEIYVDPKACAGTTPEAHEAALMVMQNCHINIMEED